MALEAQGTRLFWSASTAQSTAIEITQIVSFGGPSGSAGIIDITNLGSTAKEKLMGLPDEGQVTFDITYQATAASHIALRADRASRSKRNITIAYTDAASSIDYADAYCTGFSISGGVDDVLKASVTLEITGPITSTTN